MYTYVIPCLLGLEKLVSDECKRLGLQDVKAENGRVLCRGTLEDCARLNINLRCGARVMLVLADFPARSFEELFQGTRAVAWEDYLPRDAAFPVKGYSISSQLHAVPACQSIIKKAMVERMKAAYHLEQFPETGTKYQVRFAIFKDQVLLTLDTSGEGLFKRGYRAVGVEAPLRETLAAALRHLGRRCGSPGGGHRPQQRPQGRCGGGYPVRGGRHAHLPPGQPVRPVGDQPALRPAADGEAGGGGAVPGIRQGMAEAPRGLAHAGAQQPHGVRAHLRPAGRQEAEAVQRHDKVRCVHVRQ